MRGSSGPPGLPQATVDRLTINCWRLVVLERDV